MEKKQRDEDRTESKLQEIGIEKLDKVTGGYWDDGGWGGGGWGGYDAYAPGGGWGGGWGSGWCW